jgi:hypothetical protein
MDGFLFGVNGYTAKFGLDKPPFQTSQFVDISINSIILPGILFTLVPISCMLKAVMARTIATSSRWVLATYTPIGEIEK